MNTLGFDIGKDIEVDYCFGIILNHCARNISLDFYMQVPAKGVNKTTRVYHNSLRPVPGLSYTVNNGTVAQGFLYFEMSRSANTVKFSVTVKVKLTIYGFSTWPSSLQRDLISDETVPVPSCDPGTPPTPSKPTIGECHPPHWKSNGHNRLPAGVTGDLGKLCAAAEWCTRDRWLACDRATRRCVCKPDYPMATDRHGNKFCQPLPWRGASCSSQDDCSSVTNGHCINGVCQCLDGDAYDDETKTCQSTRVGSTAKPSPSSTDPGGVKAQPHRGTVDKDGQNKVAVIAGAVIGGLVVLAGILVAAYFAIRRLRRPYHNRQLLLEGEDGDGIM